MIHRFSNFLAMEAGGIVINKGLQLLITDFFHTHHVPLTEPRTSSPFHQSLITDYFREIDLSNYVVSESFFDERRTDI